MRRVARNAVITSKCFIARQLGDQRYRRFAGTRAANACMCFRGEVAFDDLAVGGVLGRVHRIGDRQVIRRCVAEGFVILQRAHHIFVAKQRPPQILAVGDRTALAHRIVGGNLVGAHLWRCGIPVGGFGRTHGVSSVVRDRGPGMTSACCALPAHGFASAIRNTDDDPCGLIYVNPPSARFMLVRCG